MKKLVSLFFSIFSFAFSLQVGETIRVEKNGSYYIHSKIPVLKSSNPAAVKSINSEIESITKYESGVLKKISTEFYNSMKGSKNSSALLPFELFSTYEVKKNGLNILSLVYEINSYTGGSHGITKVYSFNIDQKTEKKIYLKNLFKSNVDYRALLTKLVAKNMRLDNAKDDDDPTKFMFFEDAYIDIDKAIFYFQGKNLVLQFPLYELAPYSSGMPEFCFPLTELRAVLSKEFLARI